MQLVLLEEACRIADRLATLDRMLSGTDKAWLRLAGGLDVTEVTVTVDKALSEARQQAVALKQLVTELRQSMAPPKTAARPSRSALAKAVKPEVSSGVADLTARIRARSG